MVAMPSTRPLIPSTHTKRFARTHTNTHTRKNTTKKQTKQTSSNKKKKYINYSFFKPYKTYDLLTESKVVI
jgi:hypothetical protein